MRQVGENTIQTDVMSEPFDSGFQIIEGVFGADEIDCILDALADGAVTRTKAGARHLLAHTAVADLARHPRLLRIAHSMLGCQPCPFRATLFDKSRDSNWLVVWHQDTALPLRERFEAPGWGPWSLKAGVHYAHAPADALAKVVALRVHLDRSTTTNGPLRVLPGSHTLGVLSDESISRLVGSTSAVECLVRRGGVLAMYPLLVHSSSKSQDPTLRRVLHLEYAECLTLSPGIQLAVA